VANRVLAEQPGPVLDLGCGNGALLKKLLDANPSLTPFGIDVDPGRVAHARELLPQSADNFVAGNLFDTDSFWPEGRRYTLALLMPGRLLEATAAQAARLRTRLKSQCDRVLIYAYGDWLTRHGSLKGLAEAAGLKLLAGDEHAPAGLAEVMEPGAG
jgi:SAM-dependent methyltransferase